MGCQIKKKIITDDPDNLFPVQSSPTTLSLSLSNMILKNKKECRKESTMGRFFILWRRRSIIG